MTKRIQLDRLREISKQRSIRGALAPQDHGDKPTHDDDTERLRAEWPIQTSSLL